MIPISKLKISEFNVRKEHDEPEKINELAKSIQENGVLQPLLVRPENTHYGIIIGSRRYSAAKKLNLKEMPVTIRDLDDTQSLIVSLIENLQRNDLQPKETTQCLSVLNQTISQRDLATKIGKSQRYIHDMVTVEELLFKLDQVGVTTEIHPKENDVKSEKAIPLYHAVFVAEAFESPELKPILNKEPNKDLEVAKAVMHTTHENVKKVLKEFKQHPEDDINEIVRQADEGLLEDPDRGHSKDYLGGATGKDWHEYEREVNYHSGELSRFLSDINHMPEPTDDVEVDFIMKSRDFRKRFVSELASLSRKGVYTRLNYLSGLIAEMMDEIQKVDKK